MDADYCDGIGDLMDRAQAWCLDDEELCNKTNLKFIQLILLRVMRQMLE